MRAKLAPHELPIHSTSAFLSVPMRRGPCAHGSGLLKSGWLLGLIELARVRADAIHLLLPGSELDLLRLARRAVAFADDVEGHFRPPAIAVAIAGGAIGHAGAVRSLVGDGFELGEGLGRGIESQRPVRRGRPNPAFAV